MQNDLITFLKNKGMSGRKLAKELNLSVSYVSLVLKGTRPVTYNFAASVSDKMGLDPVEAFVMAGLLKQGSGLGGDAQTGPEKVTTVSVAQNTIGVTNGVAQ